MAAKQRLAVQIEGRDLELSNLDKPFWPDEGITKGDLLRYYAQTMEDNDGYDHPMDNLGDSTVHTRSILRPHGVFAVISAFLQGGVNSIMQPSRQSIISDLVPTVLFSVPGGPAAWSQASDESGEGECPRSQRQEGEDIEDAPHQRRIDHPEIRGRLTRC